MKAKNAVQQQVHNIFYQQHLAMIIKCAGQRGRDRSTILKKNQSTKSFLTCQARTSFKNPRRSEKLMLLVSKICSCKTMTKSYLRTTKDQTGMHGRHQLTMYPLYKQSPEDFRGATNHPKKSPDIHISTCGAMSPRKSSAFTKEECWEPQHYKDKRGRHDRNYYKMHCTNRIMKRGKHIPQLYRGFAKAAKTSTLWANGIFRWFFFLCNF